MRAREFINDLLHCEVYESVVTINERFDNSQWLYKKLKSIIGLYTTKNIKNIVDFYSKILSEVFSDKNFLALFDGLKNIPVYYDIELSSNNIISAKTRYDIKNNSINYIQLILVVPSYHLNTGVLLSELDSVLGHEINHMIQKTKEYKNNHLMPKSNSNSDLIKFANDNHYAPYMADNVKIVNYYYLNNRELDSHAYTYGIRLWHQFGNKSIDIIKLLFNKLWDNRYDPSIDLKFNNIIIDRESVLGLYNFANNFKMSEKRKFFKDNLKAIDLWKKLFTEMYKYLNHRITMDLGK